MKRQFKRRLKNHGARVKTPAAKRQEKHSWPPDTIHWAGPGSLTEAFKYLGGRHIKNCCESPSECDHRFSLHQGWEILCHLSWLSDEKLAELPLGIQQMVRDFKNAEAERDKIELRVKKYLPTKGRLWMELNDSFSEILSTAVDFCTAWAYATGSGHGRELLRKKIWELSKEVDSLSFDQDESHLKRAYLAPVCRDIGGAKKVEQAAAAAAGE